MGLAGMESSNINNKGNTEETEIFNGSFRTVSDLNSEEVLIEQKKRDIEDNQANTTNYYDKYSNLTKPAIWFNNWFSAIVVTIMDIKHTFGNQLRIIGTNRTEQCTYKNIVDKFLVEPSKVSSEEYVKFALEFCKSNNIKIFFPKAYMNAIAFHKSDFEKIGVTLVCEEYKTLDLFKSKQAVYEELKRQGYDKIPSYSVVSTTQEFEKKYLEYISSGEKVCCKFDRDEGASSFRVITDSFLNYKSLSEPLENLITFDNMKQILYSGEKNGRFKDLMVMPVLLGPEVSVDCYMSPTKGFIAIPRFKHGSRIKEIEFNSTLIEDCKRLQSIFGLKSIFNVQYRWDREGNPKLLEINTRMSGGIQLSSMCGFSIPRQLLADVLKIDSKQSLKDTRECTVTQYENPIIL